MTIYLAPDILPATETSGLFIAGGISNCPDWQTWMVDELRHLPVDLYNPRRSEYMTDTDAREQIEWEFHALNKATAVLFWFPEETLCPITLFELGRFSHQKNTPVFVGVHPNYQRKLDVETQLQLARPEITVVTSLEDLRNQVIFHYSN